ncbi:hypothetical protein V498_09926, partial [Pseudogymnoascus sp. VKM F-4517 (FW-2822)]
MPQRKPLQHRQLTIRQPPRPAGVVVLPAVRRDGARRDAGAVPGTLVEGLGERGGEVVVGCAGGDGAEERVDGGVGLEVGGGVAR